MDNSSIEDSLGGLEELAKRIERCQRFGQPVQLGIVGGWATTMNFHLQNLRKAISVKQAAEGITPTVPVTATNTGLVRDFTVKTKYW